MTNKIGTPESGHFHAVRFYEGADSLARIVANFVAEGLIAHQPAIIIATSAHTDGIRQQLEAMSFDLDKLREHGDLVVLDAREVLDCFMIDGMPNEQCFHDAVVPVLDRALNRREGQVIRAYGEMVDLLWKSGMEAAAVRLEMLWNRLANDRRFSLLCGYSMGHFYKDAGFKDICDQHTHVMSATGQAAPLGFARTTPG